MTPRHARLARLALLPALALAAGFPLIAGGSLPAAAQEGGAAGEKPAAEAPAAEKKGVVYHFGVTEQRTNILFESETTVETIHGITHSVKGKGTFDFDAGTGEADLVVPVNSLKTGMEARDGHMYGEDWLDAAKYPEIVLKAKSLKRVKVLDEKAMKETWAYEGTLTIKGKSNDVKGEALVQRIPEELGKKLGRGQWLKVKAEFSITIKDYGIEVPAASAAKVSDVWDIKIDLFATTAEPAAK
ncbi:MAG: YceI family protein [Planctomycetaceae bacterium]|nr:YceI family protein [Planctomycetota bacterium]NUN52098.1 YceI family protein [Planctomycetaceae bacterium]